MSKIIGPALPNIPWQDKPAGTGDHIWRYTNNPIIKRHAIPSANSVFNSAVVPFKGGFAGVFRCDDRAVPLLWRMEKGMLQSASFPVVSKTISQKPRGLNDTTAVSNTVSAINA